MGIRGHIHVEVVTEEIAFPVGIPAPVTVRLGIKAFAVTGRAAFLITVAEPRFSLLCGGAYGSAVTGQGQVVGVNQAMPDGNRQELLFIKAEDQRKRLIGFELPTFQ